jgi:hypothetical protein
MGAIARMAGSYRIWLFFRYLGIARNFPIRKES